MHILKKYDTPEWVEIEEVSLTDELSVFDTIELAYICGGSLSGRQVYMYIYLQFILYRPTLHNKLREN